MTVRSGRRFPDARGAALLAVLLSLLAGACGEGPTVEQQVIATIREMEAHIEAGERRPFMDYIAEDFSGQDGSLDREQLRALMIMQLNRYQRLQGQLFPIQVQETGEDTAPHRWRLAPHRRRLGPRPPRRIPVGAHAPRHSAGTRDGIPQALLRLCRNRACSIACASSPAAKPRPLHRLCCAREKHSAARRPPTVDILGF
jgi:hypothetical protein